MNIHFDIEYRTVYGEDLLLNCVQPGGDIVSYPMYTTDGITWQCGINTELPIHYYYSVQEHGTVKRSEWVLSPHKLTEAGCEKEEVGQEGGEEEGGGKEEGCGQTAAHWTAENGAAGSCDADRGLLTVHDSWQDCPEDFRIAGTLVPVFSLRSASSFGVGDFGDLKEMVRWAASTDQHLLQILPINDTSATGTWRDSYPYSCISVFALHPQYIDLRQLPQLHNKNDRERFEAIRKELNALPQIDYERVNTTKLDYLRSLFEQNGKTVMRSKDFKLFVKENEEWLEAYRPATAQGDTPQFWQYVQYLLAQQMRAVHEEAQRLGVLLKGDIPIGVSRMGCDVKQYPNLFNMNGQAGAPPDDFAEDGQNWGFPTYNWDEMLKDGCQWWVRRFRSMAKYFDAYRIDHVLGFFRIWEIPVPEKSGLLGQFSPALPLSRDEILQTGVSEGALSDLFLPDHRNPELYHPRISAQKTTAFSRLSNNEQQAFNRLYDNFFYHRHNQFWYDEAMKKLPRLVGATRMLCCAEDLGMVPACVQWVMDRLEILSLELESMPKEPWTRFGHVENNPRRSVATISSHDTPTLRMWWDEDEERTHDYYNNILHHDGPAPHPLSGELAAEIISRHLNCPSMLCVISIQDWLAMDEQLRLPDANAERVNIPANPEHYWRYRMHINIEDLMHATELNEHIKTMIVSGRRNPL